MKLSFANFPLEYYAETMADEVLMLQTIKDCGFTCIDYNIRADYLGDDYAERALQLKANLAALDMAAPQAHAPIVNPFDPEANAMIYYERSLEFCRIAEIPMVVVHAGVVKDNTRAEYFDNNEAFYRSLIPAMERTGVEVLIENIGTAIDGNFLMTGADMADYRIVGLKSMNHFRAYFLPIADGIVTADTPSSYPADLNALPFRNISRPIYPLDPNTEYTPE